jgi:hypothetical protein
MGKKSPFVLLNEVKDLELVDLVRFFALLRMTISSHFEVTGPSTVVY